MMTMMMLRNIRKTVKTVSRSRNLKSNKKTLSEFTGIKTTYRSKQKFSYLFVGKKGGYVNLKKKKVDG